MDSSPVSRKIRAEIDVRIMLPESAGQGIDVFVDIGEAELGKVDLEQSVLEMARDAEEAATLNNTAAALRRIADQVEAQLTRLTADTP